jgi:hypothetical protein
MPASSSSPATPAWTYPWDLGKSGIGAGLETMATSVGAPAGPASIRCTSRAVRFASVILISRTTSAPESVPAPSKASAVAVPTCTGLLSSNAWSTTAAPPWGVPVISLRGRDHVGAGGW